MIYYKRGKKYIILYNLSTFLLCMVLGQLILLSATTLTFPTGHLRGERESGGLQNRLYWFHAGKSKNERAAIYILKLGLRGSRFVFSFPRAFLYFVDSFFRPGLGKIYWPHVSPATFVSWKIFLFFVFCFSILFFDNMAFQHFGRLQGISGDSIFNW